MRVGLIAILLLATVSCSDEVKVPKGVLPPKKMSVVLWDIIRVDEAANHLFRLDTSYNLFLKSASLYQSVFRLHQTTESQFKQSFRYYQAHPDHMKIVLDSVDAIAKKPVDTLIKKPIDSLVIKKA
ncbi:MAG: hypothetical protein JWP69_101 [Flaviaesturariibacter sp.]|nr:hypothetical protein [Flaviaesturariibacter sp.]